MRRPLSASEALAMLGAHPGRIAAAMRAPGPRSRRMVGTWTATDVLAHLRACSDVFVDVVPRIVAAERPRLDVIGPRERLEVTGYRRLAFAVSLRDFVRQRTRLLAIIRGLPQNGGSREAVIVERGRARVRTVHDYIDWLARHEERHVEQFERFGRVSSTPAAARRAPPRTLSPRRNVSRARRSST